MIITANPDEDNYSVLKEAIPQRYDLSPGSHWQRFRSATTDGTETYYELALRLTDMAKRWLRPDERNVDNIVDTVTLEQFLETLPPVVRVHVREQQPTTTTAAALLADNYRLAHRSNGLFAQPTATTLQLQAHRDSRPRTQSSIRCFRCGQAGHTQHSCTASQVSSASSTQANVGRPLSRVANSSAPSTTRATITSSDRSPMPLPRTTPPATPQASRSVSALRCHQCGGVGHLQ